MQVAPSHGYGSYGYTRHNGLNGIDFLSGDFDVGIDGDLLTAGIAAAAAAFFFLTYGAITAGKKKRKKRSEDETYTDQASWIPSWITGKNFQIFECTFIVQYNFEPFVFCTPHEIDEGKIPL